MESVCSRGVPPSESERTTITTPSRQPRRDRGFPQLTQRDLTTLTWIGEQYAVRFDHLQRLLARQPGKPTRVEGVLSATTTSDIISRWQRAGLADIRKLLVDELAWIWLTPAGLREIGLHYVPYRPQAFTLPHLHAINNVRLLIETQGSRPNEQGVLIWQSERSLRATEAALRGMRAKGAVRPHVPDAVVRLDVGRLGASSADMERQSSRVVQVAVEVELTAKSHERLTEVLDTLVSRYPAVWYFVAPDVVRSVAQALAELEVESRRLVRVYSLAGEELHPCA
jgi:hypothetical protein